MPAPLNPQTIDCGLLAKAVAERQTTLTELDAKRRFWEKDATLWGDGLAAAVAPWMGWIDLVATMRSRVAELEGFAAEIKDAGFKRVVLCGMGGSSLAPLVLASCVATSPAIRLTVLDLTHPASVLAITATDISKTLFIIASKSGTTAEPGAFDDYLWSNAPNGAQFVAITDPGSELGKSARERGFRRVFENFADIGGRYSALSYFGLVPAALMGLDINLLLDAAQAIIDDSAPAIELGAALGEFAKQGRNKLSFAVSEELYPLGLWLEQLIAESTGKLGRGVLPVAGETLSDPKNYGHDRVFASIRFQDDESHAPALAKLRAANHPVIDIVLADRYSIAQEFMRWEIATALVGVVLEINPFDQPNVQESKDITKEYIRKYRETGKLPGSSTGVRNGALTWYADSNALESEKILRAFFRQFGPNDFVALMAFLPDRPEIVDRLRALQNKFKDGLCGATTMGLGPRFLHSTGQFHKGGPNNGYFIQITGDHKQDASIAEGQLTWGEFINAQAAGDLAALRNKGRHTLRIHINGDLIAGLEELSKVAEAWLH